MGTGAAKRSDDCFFMKHSKVWAPRAIRRVRIRETTKIGEYLIADSLAALTGLVQMEGFSSRRTSLAKVTYQFIPPVLHEERS